ncbi:MAG: SagB family peptide dehydrogenase [Minicystis sp.]
MTGQPLTLEGNLRDEISLREGTLVDLHDGTLLVRHPLGGAGLGGCPPAVHQVMLGLTTSAADRPELWRRLAAAAGGDAEPRVLMAPYSQLLWLLSQVGVAVRHRISAGEDPILSIEPITPHGTFTLGDVPADRPLALSRFTLTRRRGESLVIEAPRAPVRLVAHSPVTSLVLHALSRPLPLAELESKLTGVPPAVTATVVKALSAARMLSDADEDRAAEPERPAAGLWDPHDLWFHTHSRIGFHDDPFGAVYAHSPAVPPLPATRERVSDRSIELPVPEAHRVLTRDPTLTAAIEQRVSIRRYGQRPITLDQLGEFLFRTARTRALHGPIPEAGLPYEAGDRPYPSGGAMYELELYLTVHRATGLPRGVYHYATDEHRLYWLHDREDQMSGLMLDAMRATGMTAPPDILVTLTSRFQRLSWKYGSIAYATTLKNVGALYQTMYLVATAMGLAPCALGSGNSVRAEQALGLDGMRESSVGEFMLGSAPEDVPLSLMRKIGPRQHETWRARVAPDWYDEAERSR